MKTFALLFLAAFLLVTCWPLALFAQLLLPLLWLVTLPFQLAAIVVGAVFAFIKALLFLPARLLGQR